MRIELFVVVVDELHEIGTTDKSQIGLAAFDAHSVCAIVAQGNEKPVLVRLYCSKGCCTSGPPIVAKVCLHCTLITGGWNPSSSL